MPARRLAARLVQVPLRRPRLLAACCVAAACVAGIAATPGARSLTRAATGGKQAGDTAPVAQRGPTASVDAASWDERALPDYTPDLAGQLTRLGGIVSDELVMLHTVQPDRAAVMAENFLKALRPVVNSRLTPEQFTAIAASLTRQHFSLSYIGITDLEAQYSTLVWVDFIRLYLQRRPPTAEEKALLTQQVDEVVATARDAMVRGLSGKVEMAEITRWPEYLRGLLTRQMDDPVTPHLKRPFTQDEMAVLKAQATDSITDAITSAIAVVRRSPPSPISPTLSADCAVSPLNGLYGKALVLQHTPVTLSAELDTQRLAERDALITKRATDFDNLPPKEKDAAWQRMQEEDRLLAQ